MLTGNNFVQSWDHWNVQGAKNFTDSSFDAWPSKAEDSNDLRINVRRTRDQRAMAAVVDQTPTKAETAASLFSPLLENTSPVKVDYSSIQGKVIARLRSLFQ